MNQQRNREEALDKESIVTLHLIKSNSMTGLRTELENHLSKQKRDVLKTLHELLGI